MLLLPALLQAVVMVDVSDSPTSNLALTLKTILSAKESLYINAYELTSPEIANAIIKQVKNGIEVHLLMEGEPCCAKKLSEDAIKIKNRIVSAMEAESRTNRFFLMSSGNKQYERRFVFNHAKYIIADEERILLGSENFTPTGNPIPDSLGNRGWQSLFHDVKLAKHFIEIFEEDASTEYGDVDQLVEGRWNATLLNATLADWQNALTDATLPQALVNWSEKNGPVKLQAEEIDAITSPNTSLQGLQKFMRSARKTLDMELMSFNSRWGTTGETSPLVEEILKAARRGVKVRVLLNDENVFHPNTPSDNGVNNRTVDFLKKAAKKEGLSIKAMIADIESMGVKYIHNKGVLVDGDKTLVSSINWNQNSVLKNREAAVAIQSEEIYKHYKELFDIDWQASSRQSKQH